MGSTLKKVLPKEGPYGMIVRQFVKDEKKDDGPVAKQALSNLTPEQIEIEKKRAVRRKTARSLLDSTEKTGNFGSTE